METTEGKRYKLSESSKVLLNDVFYGTNKAAVNDGKFDKFHRVAITDNDRDGIYDVLKVYKADTYIVKNVSPISERIDFKYGFESIDVGEENVSRIIKEDEEITFDKINPGETVSLYSAEKSDGKKIYQIYVSTDSVTDILTGIKNDDFGRFYTVGKRDYKLSDNFIWFLENDTTEEKPSIGGEYTFCISCEGEITGVASKTGGFSFGWMMRAYQHDDNDELYSVQLYKSDGSTETFNLKERVKFFSPDTGKAAKTDASVVYGELRPGGVLIYDLVAYKLNSENEITELALPLDCIGKTPGTVDYPLTKDYTNLTGYNGEGKPTYANVRCYYNILDARYNVGNVTTITYPVDKANRNDQRQYDRSQFGYNDQYFSNEELTLYNTNKFFTPTIITLGSNVLKTVDQESSAYMVVRVEDTVNEDDLPVKAVTYSNGTTEATKKLSEDCSMSEDGYDWYGVPDSPQKLKAGDVIQFETNTLGEINCVRILYKADKPSPMGFQDPRSATNSAISMASVSAVKVVHGHVVDCDDKCVLVDIAGEGEEQDIWPIPTGHSAYGKVTFNLFDTKKGEVSIVSRSELKKGDEIVLRKRYNYGVNFYIIR